MSQWQLTLDLLELCINNLQSHAPVQTVPELRQFLPAASDNSHRLILIELIKFDLAAAAEAGMDRRLDDYLSEFAAEIPPDQVPPDMVLEELQVLGDSGVEPVITEYIQKFPHLADVLRNWQGGLKQIHTLRQFAPPQNLNSRDVRELRIGTLIEDFRILRCVGKGAFASVYLALQETLQRLVALKVSSRSGEESQTLSQLDHPNIVRVYDERNLSNPPVRLLYMQFIGGGTLADCVDDVETIPIESRRGSDLLNVIASHLKEYGLEPSSHVDSAKLLHQFDWPTTVAWIGVQLCEGLDYAHRKSVIHRDIKPANILLAADGTPRLADFNVSYSGIAGRAGAAAYFGGSLAYMSPEQLEIAVSTNRESPKSRPANLMTVVSDSIPPPLPVVSQPDVLRAEDLDGRSDLFSLGVVLWEMLHGARPWQFADLPKSWTDAMKSELNARSKPIEPGKRAVVFADSPAFKVLDQTIKECLAFNREDRPATGTQLKEKLKLALHPKAASRIFPVWRPITRRIAKLSPWLVLTLGSLIPNLIAAVFNFAYNNSQIVARYPDLWPTFLRVTKWVNGIFFPLGLALVMYLVIKHSRKITSIDDRKQAQQERKSPDKPDFAWNLGHQVALICGALWLLAGLIFPALLLINDQSFRWADALHFFSSLTICGGVAMVYPFFWITWMNLMLYYPRTVAQNLGEMDVDRWGSKLRRMARGYLMTAAAIPLIALVLLAVTVDVPRHYLLATILTTAAGFAASVFAVQYIDDYVQDLQM